MRQALIKYKKKDAGILLQHDDESFTFHYLDSWLADLGNPPVSLTLPLSQKEYHSEYLFPFFFHLVPEGANKEVVCHAEQLDTDDYFGILLTTARYDTIGAVTVHKIEEKHEN